MRCKLVYLAEIIHNEGLKVSATIATIATIAKRVFLAERIDDIEIQVYRRFSW